MISREFVAVVAIILAYLVVSEIEYRAWRAEQYVGISSGAGSRNVSRSFHDVPVLNNTASRQEVGR